jgi:hypothetical protein
MVAHHATVSINGWIYSREAGLNESGYKSKVLNQREITYVGRTKVHDFMES